jgi:hypothetical protein
MKHVNIDPAPTTVHSSKIPMEKRLGGRKPGGTFDREDMKEDGDEEKLRLLPKREDEPVEIPTFQERMAAFCTKERAVTMGFGIIMLVFMALIIARVVSIEEHKLHRRHQEGGD